MMALYFTASTVGWLAVFEGIARCGGAGTAYDALAFLTVGGVILAAGIDGIIRT